MTFSGFAIWLVVGVVAGWLAGLILPSRGFGFLGSTVVGSLGARVADWLLPKLGFSFGNGLIAEIAGAAFGAVVLLAAAGLLRKKMPPKTSGSVFMGFRPR